MHPGSGLEESPRAFDSGHESLRPKALKTGGKMPPVVPGPDVPPLWPCLLLARTPEVRSPLSEAVAAELSCSRGGNHLAI